MVRIYGNVMLSPPQDVNLKQDEANVAGRKKIVYVDASSDTTVPAGSAETITIQPPSGKIWRHPLISLEVKASPGASSGSHEFKIHTYASPIGYHPIVLKGDYSTNLYLADNYPISDTVFTTKENAIFYIRQLVATYDYPLKIHYTNLTDADQTNSRIIRLLLEEEDEARGD